MLPSPAITPVPLAPGGVAGLVNLRGQIVTVIDLGRRLGISGPRAAVQPTLVVVRNDSGVAGLLVDRPGDVVEVPEAACETAPANLGGEWRELMPWVGKLPGSLLHMLDLERVLQYAGEEVLARHAIKEGGDCAD